MLACSMAAAAAGAASTKVVVTVGGLWHCLSCRCPAAAICLVLLLDASAVWVSSWQTAVGNAFISAT
jgi:hypothetical protein